MLNVKAHTRFEKDLKKYQYQQSAIDAFNEIVDLLLKCKPLAEKFRDHPLSGIYHGYRECHIKPDVLLIYRTDEHLLYLARIGSHSELF